MKLLCVRCASASKSKPLTPLSVFIKFHNFEVKADMQVKIRPSVKSVGGQDCKLKGVKHQTINDVCFVTLSYLEEASSRFMQRQSGL